MPTRSTDAPEANTSQQEIASEVVLEQRHLYCGANATVRGDKMLVVAQFA